MDKKIKTIIVALVILAIAIPMMSLAHSFKIRMDP